MDKKLVERSGLKWPKCWVPHHPNQTVLFHLRLKTLGFKISVMIKWPDSLFTSPRLNSLVVSYWQKSVYAKISTRSKILTQIVSFEVVKVTFLHILTEKLRSLFIFFSDKHQVRDTDIFMTNIWVDFPHFFLIRK